LHSLSTVRSLLARLVAFDTTSSKSNLELIAFVRDTLAEAGIESTLIPSADGKKASLFATIGPDGSGGVGLSGHSDCVPVDGQNWTSDPFTLTERDGKLYGRGSCDMKGFLACLLASLPLFKSKVLKEPVHIIVSYDEEVGCTGVRPLIARLGEDLPRPRAIIVGEPTMMAVIDAHKRIDAYKTEVTGREAHSSKPQLGVNAISVAGQLVGELDRIAAGLAGDGRDERFDPPFSTLQVGNIAGGTAPNIVPKTCRFQWQVRSLPGADPVAVPKQFAAFAETLLPRMRAIAADTGIETTHEGSVPAFQANPESRAVALALALTGANATQAVSYGTEAGLFEQAGCPTVICGPGDIEQAHAADEFVSIAQLEACMTFLAKLADRLSA
jgi:acetylornithine deacetylase